MSDEGFYFPNQLPIKSNKPEPKKVGDTKTYHAFVACFDIYFMELLLQEAVCFIELQATQEVPLFFGNQSNQIYRQVAPN